MVVPVPLGGRLLVVILERLIRALHRLDLALHMIKQEHARTER